MIDREAARILREIAWIRLTPETPASAIEVVERVPNGHAYDCEHGPGTHTWRALTEIERTHHPLADYECDDCSALGRLIRPMGCKEDQ